MLGKSAGSSEHATTATQSYWVKKKVWQKMSHRIDLRIVELTV
jgi:hypothetical protein